METTKVIKRPFKTKNIDESILAKLNSVIERTNLFILNIYNFVKLYYVSNNCNDCITKDDLYDIFLILRDGNNFSNKEHKFLKFYENTFKKVYFNPMNKDKLIDGSYLGQTIKNNINVMLSAIQNNITYNFDKYLSRFVKNYMNNLSNEQLKYNSLVKKCSLYEFCSNIDKKLICRLDKEYLKNKKFSLHYLTKLCEQINEQNEKIKYSKKSNSNIFLEELKNIKEFETTFNKVKGKILKIFKNELNDTNEIPLVLKSILNIKDQIIPKLEKEYLDELKDKPEKFIQNMIFMNKYFEENKIKTFNVFPTRSNVIPKHITLDAASISVIFCNNKYSSIEEHKKEIYQSVFKFPNSYFSMNNKYKFTGTIQTDGISLSILYMPNEQYLKKVNVDIKKHKAKDEMFTLKKEKRGYENEIKNLSKKSKKNKKEIDKLNKKLKDLNERILEKTKIKKEKEKERNEKFREDKKNRVREFKEKLKNLKDDGKEDELKIINRKNKEFFYIDDLTENELNELKETKKKLYIDQGKTELICALNDVNNSFMYYSGKERGKIIKTREHLEKINKALKHAGILEEYEELKKLNKKTTSKENIIEALIKMNEINEKVYKKCKNKRLRKEKLDMYIDKQKAEAYLIKKLMKQLNIKDTKELKEYTIIIGDWKGNNNLKNNKSTMGVGMKRLLKKYVKNLYIIDEYRTSIISNINYKMYNENEEKKEYYLCQEHKIEIKSVSKKKEIKVINKRMHGILTFKMDKKRIQCKYSSKNKGKIITIQRYIQRDKNAVLNFKTITDYFLESKERPLAFKRQINNGKK